MKTFKDVAQIYQDKLSTLYSSEETKQLFMIAYAELTEERSMAYLLNSHTEIQDSLYEQFLTILVDLESGRPIQHILGKADFYGLQLYVNNHTLIPRPETEELVDWIIQDSQSKKDLSILDIGTGSGCIALALKKHLPHAQIDAIDLEAPAIAIARKNTSLLDLPINFIQADILDWESFMQENQRYDIIVSNPPYITPVEKENMHKNVLLHEPHTALFVEDHAPLLFYDTIVDIGKRHLAPEGHLYFEINQYLSHEMQDLLVKKGCRDICLRQDLNTADRMMRAKLS